MFPILKKVEYEDLTGDDLISWLDRQFWADIAQQNRKKSNYISDEKPSIDKWGRQFKENCPKDLAKSLLYIRSNSIRYPYQNYLSRTSFAYVWPLFFEKFPLGQIWLPKISESWIKEVRKGKTLIAKETGYDQEHPDYPYSRPQDASGLQLENFPLHVLNVAAFGIYPLILCDYILTPSELVFVYLPDRAFSHSQMTEGGTLYQATLWKIHHIFDDQWTFDSGRGPKRAANPNFLNPIKNLDYFDWLINQISQRMSDIAAISDPFLREQIGMTVNRAICDCQLCVNSESPYMAKVFFFSCLDKLANLMVTLRIEKDETEAWRLLMDEEFLRFKVLTSLENITCNIGTYVRYIVEHVLEEMEMDNLTPSDLRDIRNSQHGYNLRPKTLLRLMRKTGEINNDITLIATPLVLYFLSHSWKI